MLRVGFVVSVVLAATVIFSVVKVHAPPRGPGSGNHVGPREVNVDGVAERGNTLGMRNAPVTLQYFAELGSHRCRVFTFATLPAIIQKWVRTGRLKIEYKALRSAIDEPTSESQQLAALAAGKQDKLWYFVELFYDEQEPRDASERFIEFVAKQVPGLDVRRWKASRGGPVLAREIAGDMLVARRNGIKSGPSFLVGRTGQAMRRLRYRSLLDVASFDKAIERLQRQ